MNAQISSLKLKLTGPQKPTEENSCLAQPDHQAL